MFRHKSFTPFVSKTPKDKKLFCKPSKLFINSTRPTLVIFGARRFAPVVVRLRPAKYGIASNFFFALNFAVVMTLHHDGGVSRLHTDTGSRMFEEVR